MQQREMRPGQIAWKWRQRIGPLSRPAGNAILEWIDHRSGDELWPMLATR
jgi:hypothetical protein